MSEISTKPFLLRALYEWCTENGYTPHIAVKVDHRTRVPAQFVRDGEIVLNISFEATTQLSMRNDVIEFGARFGGKPHKIEVPVSNVLAIYARENGQGMAFPAEDIASDEEAQDSEEPQSSLDEGGEGQEPVGVTPSAEVPAAPEPETAPKGGRGHLKIVK